MKTLHFWLSASALALVHGGAALAQDATASAQSSAASTAPGEIVVTAQRRSENLMTTAISASVLSGKDLANKGVITVDQLQFHMPSVTVDNFGQGLEFNIRGIGKAEHNTQTTTGVITYRDGVATFPGYFQEEPYYDIANVQVLRGPQGTIAGQNSTGGAVFVNTNDPVIDGGYHGYILGQYGNYNDLAGQGAINIPVSSTFAARVAFYGDRRDSFYHITGPGGAHYPYNPGNLREAAMRFSFLWKPTEHLSILSKTDIDRLDMGGYPADPYYDRFKTIPVTGAANPTFTDPFHIAANAPQAALDKFVRTSLKIDYTFDGGTKLRSVSGYQTGRTSYTSDLDGTAAPGPAGNQTFFDKVGETIYSEEVNLISADDKRLTWLLGSYGQWDTYHFLKPYQFLISTPIAGLPVGDPASLYALQGTNPQRSLAAFGQIGFKLTSKLKIELGGRYTDSHTRNDVSVIQYGALIDDQQSAKSHNFSYKASIDWTIDHNNFLYAFIATGFRPGGLNVPVGLGQPAPFDPEKVTSYEAGWKASFLGGHLRTTVDGYYNAYKNFQVSIGYPTFPTFSIEMNVPSTTKIYGFEGDALLTLGGFSVDTSIGWLHSSLGKFFATDPRAPSVLPCDPASGPASVTCIDLQGRDQTYAPNFTFNVGAQYDLKLHNGDVLTPRINFGHVAAQWATLFETPARGDRLGARNILGAQLGFQHRGWTVTLYGTNLTNQHYIGALNSNLDFAGPPRQYGIQLMKVF
jgi:iron complex outermembrane receptor protein